MNMHSNPEVEFLLDKYSAGRIPPLVDFNNPEAGLVNSELLELVHTGLVSKHSIPIGILLADTDSAGPEERWENGDFKLNELAKPHWPDFCLRLRERPVGDEVCEKCDKRHALIAQEEENCGAIAYLCDSGLVDFAAPIRLGDETVAVLFSGQFKPKYGPIWNSEFVQVDGVFRPLEPEEEGVSAWTESLQRIDDIERRLELPENALIEYLLKGENPARVIHPDEVAELKDLLSRIATRLSDLATSTYELERGRLVDWIRNRITSSLLPLGVSEDSPSVWRNLSDGLAHLATYFGLDYCLILSCCGKNNGRLGVVCHSGLPEAKFPLGGTELAPVVSLSRLKELVCDSREAVTIILRDFKDLPFFNQLHRLHGKSKQQALIVPLVAPRSTNSIMVLGRFKEDMEVSFLQAQDSEALERVIREITLVVEIVTLVEELEETTDMQARFFEDVAHNLRTPVQNIIVEAEVLKRSSIPTAGIERRAHRIASQVRRLHLLSLRAWTLVNIDSGQLELERKEKVSIFQIIMEQRKSLLDLAKSRGIEIQVDRELEDWSPIRTNRSLFRQAVLNLMDNAVKYSQPGTEVRVDGKRLPPRLVEGEAEPGSIALSFVNRGIPIKEKEKDRIWERYYRTEEAKRLVITGTGIGLSIVKALVDYHKGSAEIKSMPIQGTEDYVTEIKILIPDDGGYYA